MHVVGTVIDMGLDLGTWLVLLPAIAQYAGATLKWDQTVREVQLYDEFNQDRFDSYRDLREAFGIQSEAMNLSK